MASLYCIDTSVLIDCWWNLYRPRAFPAFWRRLDEAIGRGAVIAPLLVLKELERQDDDVLAWAKARPQLFHPLTDDVQRVQQAIVRRFPAMVNEENGRSMCDPWVIGLAQLRQCPVVSQEKLSKRRNPHMPNVCVDLGIPYLNVADMIDDIGWVFS